VCDTFTVITCVRLNMLRAPSAHLACRIVAASAQIRTKTPNMH